MYLKYIKHVSLDMKSTFTIDFDLRIYEQHMTIQNYTKALNANMSWNGSGMCSHDVILAPETPTCSWQEIRVSTMPTLIQLIIQAGYCFQIEEKE